MPRNRKGRRTEVPPRGRRPRRGPKYTLTQAPQQGEPDRSLPDADRRALGRLARAYGPDTIGIAVKGVVLPKVGRPRCGWERNALAPLSLADTKELARLVRKYEREFIIGAAHQVVPRDAGRPRLGDEPYYERMHLADWLKDCAEEYRARGSRYPEHDAALELHELLFGGGSAVVSDAWLKTIKNKRLLGEKGYRNLARQIQEQPKAAKAHGMRLKSLPRWLKPQK